MWRTFVVGLRSHLTSVKTVATHATSLGAPYHVRLLPTFKGQRDHLMHLFDAQ